MRKALVSGHVDKRELQRITVSGLGLQVGKAEVDRDATIFLFLPAVAIDTGQRLDQTGLAMVDMTCGAYNNAAHVSDPEELVEKVLDAPVTSASGVRCAPTPTESYRLYVEEARRADGPEPS